ncbi:9741_t:CDS:10, partial [Scutellospora calospora]
MEIVLPKFRLLDATQKSDDSIKKNIDIYGIESQISSLRNHDHNRIRLAKNTKINANISNRIHHVNDDIDPNKIKNRTRNSESFSSQKTLVNKDPELFEDNDSIMESIDEEPINVDEQLNNDEKIIENMSTLNNNMQKEGFHPLRQTNSELSLKRDEGETVEWLNYLLQQIWQTFDPSLLVGLRDMLEDAMSRSAPSFVRATDIEAFEIGLVAPRIESIKIFPLSESNNDDVVIGEARFSFRARSSKTIQDPPPHILAWIKTGISALIPIRVELLALIASIHFEIKLTGTSPFVSTARISFLNIPVYETSIMPLIPMNIAQFPLIKQFIRSAVHSVLEELTYPKFRDINLAELLSTYNDTQSIGIMKVDIFRAINLTKVDVHGENDPYVLSSLDPTPYAHTHNSTRIIENCANPEWNETFFHKIPQLDLVDQHIKFKLSVMDWDRFTPDDLIGNVWIDIKNAIGDGTKGVKIHDGLHDIYLKTTDSSSRGQLQFRLEYFPKSPNDAEP